MKSKLKILSTIGLFCFFIAARAAYGTMLCDIEDMYGNPVNYVAGSLPAGFSNQPANGQYWLNLSDSAGMTSSKFTVKFNSAGFLQKETQSFKYSTPFAGQRTPFAFVPGSINTYGPATLTAKDQLGTCKNPFIATYAANEATFVSGPLAIPDISSAGANSTINVVYPTGTITHVTVTLWISHTYDSDLKITLIAPDSTTVVLSNHHGNIGNNYGTNSTLRTIFDDSGSSTIASQTPPFTGMYQPDEPLATFNGHPAVGTWTLHVEDNSAADVGTINAWSIMVSDKL